MRRTKKQNLLINNLIYVIIGILVIVLVVLILGTVLGSSGKNKNGKKTDSNTKTISEIKKELKKQTPENVTELMQQYYAAMSASDITTLEQIVSDISDQDKENIRRKKVFIEAYNNINVYSKDCPAKGSYLVFVEYDIKFKNEDTFVPGLETHYVKTTKEGGLYIYKGDNIEKDVQDFITAERESDEVQQLLDDVNERYVDALASSPTLLEFIEGFGGDTTLIEQAKKKAASGEVSAKATSKPKEDEETPAPTEETPTETPAADTPQQTPSSTDVNETVLITANVNLRGGNDESAQRITTMIVGDQATRIETTDNGWSKVQYNGMEGYVKSDYVTTFRLTGDTVKPTTTINVRLEASETANMAGQVTSDTTLTRYAACDNGWSQIQFNGGVGYVKTEYLTN